MNIFDKLDRSSRILFLTAILGIVLSLAGLYFLGIQNTEHGGNLVAIGNISRPENDVRVKRSDTIHWYPVNQTISCYEDDLVFTGNDSTSEITLLDGGKIALFPNSLISLSKGRVSLESGTIEIDLSESKGALRLQSFGEEVNLTQASKVQVKKQKGVKKIVYLNEAAARIRLPPVMEKVRGEMDIKLLAPTQGALLPHHPNYPVTFSWSGTKASTTQLEFYRRQQGLPFLTETVSGDSFQMTSDKFPEGQVFWKVRQDKVPSDMAHFTTTSDFGVTYLHPAPEENLQETERKEMVFRWTPRFSLPQRVQIAQEAGFKKPIYDNRTTLREVTTILPQDGSFFWRVGTVFPNGEVQWSKSSHFTFATRQNIKSINLSLGSTLLDFSVEKSYSVKIQDQNPCESYEVTLSRHGEVLSQSTLTSPEYTLTKLENGLYELQVIGKKGGAQTEAKISFEVKNAPPLRAPKIIKKKKKLFVHIFRSVVNALIPLAHADEGRIELEWEDDGSDLYEIDVRKDGDKSFLKKTVKKSSYVLLITEPGKYLWRVRSMKNNTWGPFSEFDEIDASDKVQLLSSPLMISGNVTSADETGQRVSFSWRAPYNDLTYKLELSNSPTGRPFKVMNVTGQTKSLKFSPKMKSIWWRVSATSKHGLENRDKSRLKVEFTPLPHTRPPEKKNTYLIHAYVGQNMSSYSQKVESGELSLLNKSESLMGQNVGLSAEIWPQEWKKDVIITAGMDYMMLSSSDSKLNRSSASGELGKKFWIGGDRYHALLLGFHKVIVNLDINEASTQLDMNFFSTRYVFRKDISERAFWEAMADMKLLLKQDFIQPSLEAAYSYYYLLKSDFYLKGFLSFERAVYKVPYNEQGVQGDLTVNLQNVAGGVGLSWLIH